MIINFSSRIQATVKCSDGSCYPCLVLSMITTGINEMLPRYGIQFIDLRPDNVIVREIAVSMKDVNLGGQNVITNSR